MVYMKRDIKLNESDNEINSRLATLKKNLHIINKCPVKLVFSLTLLLKYYLEVGFISEKVLSF